MSPRTFYTPFQLFWQKVQVSDSGCWEWTASKNPLGYGTFGTDGRTASAHRFAYEHFIASIPDGLELDHTCRNRACVNPAHLEPVTHAENMARARRCANGHFLTPENVLVRPSGYRACRECQRERSRRFRNRSAA